jgi:AraC-like DNA-binding protein
MHAMPWEHAHGDIEVNYAYSGSPRYKVGDRLYDLPAGCFVAFWAATPHRVVHVPAGTQFMWLHVPLTMALRWQLGTGFLSSVFSGELVIDGTKLAWDAAMSRRWLRDLASHDADSVRTVELEVHARLGRFRCDVREGTRTDGERSGGHAELMSAYLTQHFQDDVHAADVGAAAGLNQHYAMRVFRREYGLSIWQYVLRLRLSHAQSLLLTTDMPVLSVGQEAGFRSGSRFYEIFTRECRMSPAEYRRRAHGGKTP